MSMSNDYTKKAEDADANILLANFGTRQQLICWLHTPDSQVQVQMQVPTRDNYLRPPGVGRFCCCTIPVRRSGGPAHAHRTLRMHACIPAATLLNVSNVHPIKLQMHSTSKTTFPHCLSDMASVNNNSGWGKETECYKWQCVTK